jgi:hypothetical protein
MGLKGVDSSITQDLKAISKLRKKALSAYTANEDETMKNND